MERLTILSLFISILALYVAIFLSRTGFTVQWIPKIKKKIPCSRNRELNIRIICCSKRGNTIIQSIEKITAIHQDDSSEMSVKDARTNQTITNQNGCILRVEEGISQQLIVTFQLSDDISLPFDDETGLKISTSVKNIEKTFTIQWS